MRIKRLIAAGLVVSLGAVPALSSPAAADSATSVAVDRIDGQRIVDGRISDPVTGDTLNLSGRAALAPLRADAGDSRFARVGSTIPVNGLAYHGRGDVKFAWSYDGSAERFAAADEPATTFDTDGLAAGQHDLQLSVTDSAGHRATDTVRIALWSERAWRTIASASGHVALGLPDETSIFRDASASGKVDGASEEHRADVAEAAERLRFTLNWGREDNDFDLRVDDPSDREDFNTSASTAEYPEILEIADPAAGTWTALVHPYFVVDDEYELTVEELVPPASPLPALTAGPWRFDVGRPQALTATVHGGTAPVALEWDLDGDGITDARGPQVAVDFPTGTHLVTVKATDGNGYEQRLASPVRVVRADTGADPGIVVVAINDTGLNVYHRDFSAQTFPDERIHRLTNGFTRHPSEYIPGYPADSEALPVTLGQGYRPAVDEALWQQTPPAARHIQLEELYWIPGTKVVGAIDRGDTKPVNGDPDTSPILDDDGHGTGSASVAVGNVYGFCPTCLLVVIEDLGEEDWAYRQPWIDIVSNSHGTLANIGFGGTVLPSMPKYAAERGQLGLYAAGNGNENAFVTPQQTYLPQGQGPGWAIRVGAADRTSRKPIVGTGKPVDVTSWGYGTIRAAAVNSDTAEGSHSGTSAAAPYVGGVFGTVLGQIREALGDVAPGQKPAQQGAVAAGAKIKDSPYLHDGVLTRTELVEAVFKTAEHDQGAATTVYPFTTPRNEFQYAVEGYGIVEGASGERAADVLLGRAPLPDRDAEEEFFRRDAAIRDALWGTWRGGGRNSAAEDSAASQLSSPLSVAALARLVPADVDTFDKAVAVMRDAFGLMALSSDGEASSAEAPSLTVTKPGSGVTVDPSRELDLAVAGTATFPARPASIDDAGNYRLYVTGQNCADGFALTFDQPSGTATCVPTLQAVTPTNIAEFRYTYPLGGEGLPVTLEPGRIVGGQLHMAGRSAAYSARFELVTLSAGEAQIVASTRYDGPVLPDDLIELAMEVDPDFAGVALENLAFSLVIESSAGAAGIRYNGATFLDVPFATEPGDPRIELAVNDETFYGATIARTADGSWSTDVDVTGLANGPHTLLARAVQGTTVSDPVRVPFEVKRTLPSPPAPRVEVQVTRPDQAPSGAGWQTMNVSQDGSGHSWSGSVDLAGLRRGSYVVHSRLIVGGVEVARGAPVQFRRR